MRKPHHTPSFHRAALRSWRLSCAAGLAVVACWMLPGSALAITEVQLLDRFGPEVNVLAVENKEGVEREDFCVQATERCQTGALESPGIQGQFRFPSGVAINQAAEDLYVADLGHNRIDEYDSHGKFILAFGKEVNEAKQDICHEGEKCLPGSIGGEAGELGGKISAVAAEQSTGNVYVADIANNRVIEYKGDGQFVLAFGGKVNKTAVEAKLGAAAENVCTAASKDACQAGVEGAGSGEFAGWPNNPTALIAVGGPPGEEHVYVGDGNRIQEFESDGKWVASIDVTTLAGGMPVQSLAIDETGNVYFTAGDQGFGYPSTPVYKLNPTGEELAEYDPGHTAKGVAVTKEGDVIVIQSAEACTISCEVPHHLVVYNSKGEQIAASEEGFVWPNPGAFIDIAYNPATKRFYTADQRGVYPLGGQVLAFEGPLTVPTVSKATVEPKAGFWLVTGNVFADQFEVTGMQAQYGWCGAAPPGATGVELEEQCKATPYESSAPVHVKGTSEQTIPAEREREVEGQVSGLEANSTYHLRLAATNSAGNTGHSTEGTIFTTPPRAPTANVSAPEEIGARSARLPGTIDPQNDQATYRIQYAPCAPLASCGQSIAYTPPVAAGAGNKAIRLSEVVEGLQPSTTYSYRILATNAAGQESQSSEETLQTAPPRPPAASVGAATAITQTTATLSASIDPEGASTAYQVEIGVDEGAGTLYSPIGGGEAGQGEEAVSVTIAASDLQPDTSYRYRITAISSEGRTTSNEVAFTTQGPPPIVQPLAAIPLLPNPLAVGRGSAHTATHHAGTTRRKHHHKKHKKRVRHAGRR